MPNVKTSNEALLGEARVGIIKLLFAEELEKKEVRVDICRSDSRSIDIMCLAVNAEEIKSSICRAKNLYAQASEEDVKIEIIDIPIGEILVAMMISIHL